MGSVISKDKPPGATIGLNSAGFSIGHLKNTGLAAEIRNPGVTALSRLMEKTSYRADLRSDSISWPGLAFMAWGGRAGIVFNQQEKIDTSIIWIVPVQLDFFTFELLGETGTFRGSVRQKEWYPHSPLRPGGAFGLISGRFRLFTTRACIGLTTIFSGGVNLNPGWFMAVSCSQILGAWKIRGRVVYASQYFRNADGKKLNWPAGGRFVVKFQPKHGLQFFLDYEARTDAVFSDKGTIGIGWRFKNIRISLKSNWSHIIPVTQSEKGIACKDIKGSIVWDRHYFHLGIQGQFRFPEDWSLRIDVAFPENNWWLLGSSAQIYSSKKTLLLNIKLRLRLNFGHNKLIISMSCNDPGGSRNTDSKYSNVFVAKIRWIKKFDS